MLVWRENNPPVIVMRGQSESAPRVNADETRAREKSSVVKIPARVSR
jgi:hypothetical protein